MLDDLLPRLTGPSAEQRSAASDELHKLARSGHLTVADAKRLIAVAADAGPPESDSTWNDPGASILYSVRDIARDKNPSQLLPEIESVFARLTPEAMAAALQVVTLCDDPAAARLYVRCLRDHGAQLGGRHIVGFRPSVGATVASELFPALVEQTHHHGLEYPIFLMLLEFRKAGIVPPDVVGGVETGMARTMDGELQQIRGLQSATGLGWKDQDPYSRHRDLVGLMFDLAGFLDSEALLDRLHDSGDLFDPRLRRFRAVSLLRHGALVSDDEIAWVAESPRDRYWLFDQLRDLDMEDRLPPACRDQARLAEGHLVDWLCFPTELGREPDEIVQIHVETRRHSTGHRLVAWLRRRKPVDYYFFKYRVTEDHWGRERGWLVGMAGGYARESQPTTSHDGATFSRFHKFEEKSIPEHVREYLG